MSAEPGGGRRARNRMYDYSIIITYRYDERGAPAKGAPLLPHER